MENKQRSPMRALRHGFGMALSVGMPLLISGLVRIGLEKQVLQFMGGLRTSPQLKKQAFAGYQPTKHDVIVSTYAKSGTYWMLQMAYQIAHLGQGKFGHIHQVVPWPDSPMSTIVSLDETRMQEEAPTGLRVIKTHLESQYVPYHPAAQYIVVVRDPKEAFVSSYFFAKHIFMLPKMVPVAEWLDWFMGGGRFPFGSWAEHLASYWSWRERPNVLILTYGEMKADPQRAALRVADLMGVRLEEEQLLRVLAKSDFAYMKKMDHRFTPSVPFVKSDPEGGVIMRKGQSGRSSELLTLAQQAHIDQFCQEELRRLGCDFPYAEHFAVATPTREESHAPA